MRSRLSKLIINAAFSLLVFASLLLLPTSLALAADAIKFTPQIPIPGFSSGAVDVGTTNNGKMTSDLLARYIKAFYDYGLKAAGILAAVILMGGGALWLTSAGNESKIGQAREMIVGAISGLVILFSAWLILNTVNPELLKLTPMSLTNLDTSFGCCQYSDKAEMTTSNKCADGNGIFKISETDRIFNKTTNYAVSTDGKACTMPGCCVTATASNSGFRESWCMTAMKDDCSGAKSEFVPTNCETVASNDYYGCKLFDQCATAKDGDSCFSGPINTKYFCYNKICWEGDGKLNEPCGNDPQAACSLFWVLTSSLYPGVPFVPGDPITCTQSGYEHDGSGGRNCASGLACCYPK